MKALAVKLWTEPAAFIAAVVLVLTGVQQALPVSPGVHAVIAAVLIALGGQQTRARVTPTAKGGV